MRTWRAMLHLALLNSSLCFCGLADAAWIIWATREGQGARDSWGRYLPGVRVPGGPVNLSNGALVQLWKAIGATDDPRGYLPAYQSTDWRVDDILLDQVHIGYGIGPPGAPAKGEWSRTVGVDIIPGDVIYTRAYNMSPEDWAEAPLQRREVCIRNGQGGIAGHIVERVDIPKTYYFTSYCAVPEPGWITLITPGFAIWLTRTAAKRKRRACEP